MAKRFDATLKILVEAHPADWIAFAKLPLGESARVIDADLSTISPAADKVIRVDGKSPYLAHLEFQSSADAELDERMLFYHVLLRWKHKLPVRSAMILLRREAVSPAVLSSVRDVEYDDSYLDFRYRTIRLWEQPVEPLLNGGLGTLPLAPISNVSEQELPEVISKMEQRLSHEAAASEINESWTATLILLGLKYSPEVGRKLLAGVRHMKESTTYQEILAEGAVIGEARGEAKGEARGEARGRVAEARAVLMRLGTRRFGSPPVPAIQRIESMNNLNELETLIDGVIDASSWTDLLA